MEIINDGHESRERVDLCMAVPPFDQIKIPLLGPAILTAACRNRGLNVRNVFGSIILAGRTGYDDYKSVARYYLDAIVGERLFRPYAWPPEIAATLPPLPQLASKPAALHDRMAPHVGPFVDAFVTEVLALRPRILAIASTFEQIMAGSALAWRVKQALPDTIIVLGGANIAAPMGTAFAQVFPWVDHFFSGEADTAFPDFCERLIKYGERPAERVIACGVVDNIEISPIPDFTDFLAALEREKAAGRLPPHLPEGLPLESSRGCWWGMKNHCTFCGLNGTGMDFRTKTPERIIGEIKELIDRYDPPYLSFTDNIMPLSYLKTVLPELASWEEKPGLFYEVKANLKYEQLELMCRAGMTQIQPGIESLSTGVLKLMRKGISAIQNLVLLRDCTSLNLYVLWNILYGFPGEEVADYAPLPDLFARIEHFRPPGYCVPIVVDRFSPHHNNPDKFGIGSYKPYPGFAALFPPGAPVMDLAYHFIGQHSTALMADGDMLDRLHKAYDAWHEQWGPGRRPPILTALPTHKNGPSIIADTRRFAKQRIQPLTAEQDAALVHLEQPRRLSQLEPAVAALLPHLIDQGWVIEHEGFLVSVVTRPATAAVRGLQREAWVPVAA